MLTLRRFHFLGSLLMLAAAVYFQAYVLARFNSPWLQIDLVTIVVVFISIEHFLGSALIRILFAAMLMQSLSAAPPQFYVMYFLVALIVANVVSRLVVLYSLFVQFTTFAGIFLIKFLLLYLSIRTQSGGVELLEFLQRVMPSFLMTTVSAVPIFWLLTTFDSLFEVQRGQDRIPEAAHLS